MIYRFANCELNTELYELRRDEEPVSLEPQVFDLLLYLIEQRDRVVTQSELYEEIWQGRIVSEAALSSRIKSARQAVGDTGRDQSIIQTLRGRGFRLVGSVKVSEDRAEKRPPAAAPEGEFRRRLTAILAADVVGYSHAMSEDEAGTLSALSRLRKDVIEPMIAEHRGRVVKLMGDGILAEFASAVDAVNCAVAWQSGIGEEGLQFRIGINLGDIIVEGDDIYGDSVNVAARLEGLAEPGGICLSNKVYEEVRGKLNLAFEDLGQREVKNMAEAVHVYRITPNAHVSGPTLDLQQGLALPDKPSIAVLPFTNMSGDREQKYFSDGITDDIITTLSKFANLFVVARNSTFTYKGQAVDVRRVGREQGVRFVLEGSVRRDGNRLRITTQLIDAASGNHLWAERYDRILDDIFALQDEITREVTTAIQVKLIEGEQARTRAGGTKNFNAWELAVKGEELSESHVREDMHKARELLEEAVQLDPNYATAWCDLGWTHWSDARHWSASPKKSLAKAWAMAERARDLAPDLADPFALFATIALQQGDYPAAEAFADRALEQAGSESSIIANAARVLSHCGRLSEAIGHIESAMRLCPLYPNYYRVYLGRACLLTGDLKRAIATLREWQDYEPEPVEPVLLATALYDDGQREEAETLLRDAVAAKPAFSIKKWATKQTFSNPDDLTHMVDVLEELGVPK